MNCKFLRYCCNVLQTCDCVPLSRFCFFIFYYTIHTFYRSEILIIICYVYFFIIQYEIIIISDENGLVIDTVPKDQLLKLGEDAEFHCSYKGVETVQWIFKETPLNNNTR